MDRRYRVIHLQMVLAVLLNIKICPCNLLIVTEFNQNTDLLALAAVWPWPKRPEYTTKLS